MLHKTTLISIENTCPDNYIWCQCAWPKGWYDWHNQPSYSADELDEQDARQNFPEVYLKIAAHHFSSLVLNDKMYHFEEKQSEFVSYYDNM